MADRGTNETSTELRIGAGADALAAATAGTDDDDDTDSDSELLEAMLTPPPPPPAAADTDGLTSNAGAATSGNRGAGALSFNIAGAAADMPKDAFDEAADGAVTSK
jgi:hypothetical protein